MKKPATPKDAGLVANQTRMAEEINRHFNISCSKQSIQNWQRRHDPAFPAPDAGGRYNREACFTWVKENILPKKGSSMSQAEMQKLLLDAQIAEAQSKIRKEQIASREWEVVQKKYIERSLAERTIIGFSKKYHAWVRAEFERFTVEARAEKLKELGVTAETIIKFKDFDTSQNIGTVSRIEDQCSKFAESEVERMAEEIKNGRAA